MLTVLLGVRSSWDVGGVVADVVGDVEAGVLEERSEARRYGSGGDDLVADGTSPEHLGDGELAGFGSGDEFLDGDDASDARAVGPPLGVDDDVHGL